MYLWKGSEKENPIREWLGAGQFDSAGDLLDGLQHDLRRRRRLVGSGDRSWNPKWTRPNSDPVMAQTQWTLWTLYLWSKLYRTQNRFGYTGNVTAGMGPSWNFAHLRHLLDLFVPPKAVTDLFLYLLSLEYIYWGGERIWKAMEVGFWEEPTKSATKEN